MHLLSLHRGIMSIQVWRLRDGRGEPHIAQWRSRWHSLCLHQINSILSTLSLLMLGSI